jgi:hypothetical protein
MNRRRTFTLGTMALLFLGTGVLASNAVAQQKLLKDQLVGSWTLTSVVNTRADGTKYDPTGGKAVGLMMLDNTGHFSSENIRMISQSWRPITVKKAPRKNSRPWPRASSHTSAHTRSMMLERSSLSVSR